MIEEGSVFTADRVRCSKGHTRLKEWVLAAILVSKALSCAPDENGRTVIGDLPIISVERDLHIDGHSADLVPVGWMGVAPDGTIAVLQPQDRTVRFFDQDGGDLGRVGSQGDGPGEFQSMARAGWIGDTLWVSDTQLGRFTLVSTAPEILRTMPPLRGARPKPEDEGRFPAYSMAFPFAVYPGGDLLLSVLMPIEGSAKTDPNSHPLFRTSSEGVIEKLVFDIPWDPEGSVSVTFEGGSAGARVPFYSSPQWSAAPDGSRIGALTTNLSGPEAGTFQVSVYDSMGEEVFSRTYPYSGVPIPERVVDSVLEVRAERVPHPALKRAYQTEVRDRVPHIYPPVEKIVFGSDGRVWIGLYGGQEGKPWMILDGGGDPVGQVMLPPGVTLHVAGSDHIWGVERDEYDVESIIRFRIEAGGGG